MKLLPAVALSAACLGLGFYLGRTTVGKTDAVEGLHATKLQAATAQLQSEPQAISAVGAVAPPTGPPSPYTLEEVKALAQGIASGSLRGADLAAIWGQLEQRLAVSDLRALGAALREDQNEDFAPALRALFSQWAKEDPQAAWRVALAMSPPDKCNEALHAVLDVVAEGNPQQALTLAEAIQNAHLRTHMRTSALRAFAASNPAHAFQIAAQGLQNGDGSDFAAILGEWAKQDHKSAFGAAETLTGPAREKARSALVLSLAEKDPRAAWEYASRFPPSSESDWYFSDPQQQVIERWSEKDPSAALAAALTIRNENRRDYAVSTAMRAWARSDFRAALAHATSATDPILRGDLLYTLAGSSAAVGQELMSALVEHGPSGEIFSDALSTLLESWARKNPQEAAAAAKQLPPGPALANAAPRIVEKWMGSSPDKREVLAWVNALPEGYARDRAMRRMFEVWSTQDSDEALRAINAAGASASRDAMRGLIDGWSAHDAGAAAQWAAGIRDETVRDSLLQTAVVAWSRTAPARAASFVQGMSEVDRIQNTGHLVEAWASRDANGAAAWLKTQPVGAARDAGIGTFARQIAKEDPASALAWTRTISDSAKQESETESVLRDWLYYDPAGAKEWARSNSLPDKVRQKLSGRL